ncbi:actinorhodin polyketide synthase bifunctional cyclase/dehydratase [Streptomyces nigrescens]|uniref:Actinorhodin polyketide synthase bifunctional cyclase/dehydratase n=1 Tax=Streptomyces nigrescens TaxID=1920 RepID=A0ABM7ZY85_STRNI|nr:actinorhodin polyketide synthase bifunctional cyclase/dehydratase [Streptomyces nigrescens]
MAAPAQRVFDLIAEVGNWPRIFPPTVYVEYAEHGPTEERIRIWATANDEVKSWTSHRVLDRDRLVIGFRQEVSQPPVASMGGQWLIEPLAADRTQVTLLHDYRAVGDDPANVDWIERAVDRNSRAELAALRAAAERSGSPDGPEFSFEDAVHVAGSATDVYAFLHAAEGWQERLPHVRRVVLQEDVPNVQTLEMDTAAPDGSIHTTKSVRVCFPLERIVYKQLQTPALMSVHTGEWRVREERDQLVVTSAHTVVIRPEAIPQVLGEGATVGDARAFVRAALSRNSTATLHLAKEHAERLARPAGSPDRS